MTVYPKEESSEARKISLLMENGRKIRLRLSYLKRIK